MNAIKVYEDACRKVDNREITLGEFEKMVEPLMDVEPVIRCKDCKHRYHSVECPCQSYDHFYSWMPADDWFCKKGKRKES